MRTALFLNGARHSHPLVPMKKYLAFAVAALFAAGAYAQTARFGTAGGWTSIWALSAPNQAGSIRATMIRQ